MKKTFTINLGSVPMDYIASNEPIGNVKPILVLDNNVPPSAVDKDSLLHATILAAVTKELRNVTSEIHPLIYIYNAKDFPNGFND